MNYFPVFQLSPMMDGHSLGKLELSKNDKILEFNGFRIYDRKFILIEPRNYQISIFRTRKPSLILGENSIPSSELNR